jgi:4-alpha-glucanotransferase
MPRSCGSLLHPTSLPGPHGIGDLGDEAYRFVDMLAAAKQGLWQVLPLGPTSYGDSPYQCLSTFAGNPLLISPDRLVVDGLLTSDDLDGTPAFPADQVEYGAVIAHKRALLAKAVGRFAAGANPALAAGFDTFLREQGAWLDDFALFMALKDAHGGATWNAWRPEIALRRPAALERCRRELAEAITREKIVQFLFFHQWLALRRYANEHGIRLIGDMPIFVAADSTDVWSHQDLFFLDEHGKPSVVAGVPPDLFSATGQLWGNPLYRWERMARQGYAWWIERISNLLALVDVIRIDHFIGFTRYWEVKTGEVTAENGRWVPVPGAALLLAVEKALGRLPMVAEDLGLVTPEVDELRERFELPGMKVLQFAFGDDASSPHLPHNYSPNCVVYTGTHDNDTTVGWFTAAAPRERSFAQRYLARSGEDIAYDLIRLGMSSVADTVIVPLQDVLALGSEARMNVPGRPSGNWTWRFRRDMFTDAHVHRLGDMVELYGREPRSPGAGE